VRSNATRRCGPDLLSEDGSAERGRRATRSSYEAAADVWWRCGGQVS
jgi:hypothetical protein